MTSAVRALLVLRICTSNGRSPVVISGPRRTGGQEDDRTDADTDASNGKDEVLILPRGRRLGLNRLCRPDYS